MDRQLLCEAMVEYLAVAKVGVVFHVAQQDAAEHTQPLVASTCKKRLPAICAPHVLVNTGYTLTPFGIPVPQTQFSCHALHKPLAADARHRSLCCMTTASLPYGTASQLDRDNWQHARTTVVLLQGSAALENPTT